MHTYIQQVTSVYYEQSVKLYNKSYYIIILDHFSVVWVFDSKHSGLMDKVRRETAKEILCRVSEWK